MSDFMSPQPFNTSPTSPAPAQPAIQPPTAPAQSPTQSATSWKSIHWTLVVATAIAMGIAVFLTWNARGGDPLWMAEAAGRCLGLLLFPLLIGVIAFWIGRRSTMALNTAYGVVLTLAVVGMFNQKGHEAARKQAAAMDLRVIGGLQDEVKQFREEARANADAGDATANVESAREVVKGMEAAADKMSGNGATVMRISAELTAQMVEAAGAVGTGMQRFAGQGGLDPSTLTTRQSLDERIATAEGVVRANNALTEFVRNAPGEFQRRLVAAGFRGEELKEMVRGFSAGAKTDQMLAFQKVEGVVFAAALKYLSVLRDHSGKWAFDQRAGKVRFLKDDGQKAFDAAMVAIETAGKAEQQWLARNQGFLPGTEPQAVEAAAPDGGK